MAAALRRRSPYEQSSTGGLAGPLPSRAPSIEPSLAPSFEVLHGSFMGFRFFSGSKRTEVSPPPGLGIALPGIEPIFPRPELTNHESSPKDSLRSAHFRRGGRLHAPFLDARGPDNGVA